MRMMTLLALASFHRPASNCCLFDVTDVTSCYLVLLASRSAPLQQVQSPFLQEIDETELENSCGSAEEVLAELLKALFYHLPQLPIHWFSEGKEFIFETMGKDQASNEMIPARGNFC